MTKAQKAEYKAKRMSYLAEAQAIVSKGVCPTCGTKLYRNNSLAGWWMCAHRGAVGFQKEAGPHCDFQIFYDPTPEEHRKVLDGFVSSCSIHSNHSTPQAAAKCERLRREAENVDPLANMPGIGNGLGDL